MQIWTKFSLFVHLYLLFLIVYLLFWTTLLIQWGWVHRYTVKCTYIKRLKCFVIASLCFVMHSWTWNLWYSPSLFFHYFLTDCLHLFVWELGSTFCSKDNSCVVSHKACKDKSYFHLVYQCKHSSKKHFLPLRSDKTELSYNTMSQMCLLCTKWWVAAHLTAQTGGLKAENEATLSFRANWLQPVMWEELNYSIMHPQRTKKKNGEDNRLDMFESENVCITYCTSEWSFSNVSWQRVLPACV